MQQLLHTDSIISEAIADLIMHVANLFIQENPISFHSLYPSIGCWFHNPHLLAFSQSVGSSIGQLPVPTSQYSVPTDKKVRPGHYILTKTIIIIFFFFFT